MTTQNGTTTVSNHPALDARFDALKSGVRKLIDRVMTQPVGEPSRIARLASSARTKIKAHPIAAAAIALGVGYMFVRIARRR